MKIPVITWTVLELGSRNPVVRELFTKARRHVGRFIAGDDVTRKDLERLQESIDSIKEIVQQKQDDIHEKNGRMDDSEVRTRTVRNYSEPERPVETSPGNRDSSFPTSGI